MSSPSAPNRQSGILGAMPHRIALALALSLTCCFFAAPASFADDPGPGQLTLREGEASQIRTRLVEIIIATEALLSRSGSNELAAATASARDSVFELSDEDLVIFAGQLPSLNRLAVMTNAMVEDIKRIDRENASSPHAADPGLPSAGYSFCGSVRTSTTTMHGLLTGLFIAQGIADAARRACDQLVAGFNASPACAISDAIWLELKFAYEELTFCIEDIDSAEILGNFERLEHIHENLDSAREEIADNRDRIVSAREAILTAISDGLMEIIDAIHAVGKSIQQVLTEQFDAQNLELRTWRANDLRTLIEQDLGRGDEVDRIASFELPASIVCASAIDDVPCGSLETVQDIVEETIIAMENAGLDTFGAQGFFEKGSHAFTLGEYKSAYHHFTTAYRLATGLEPPPIGACCRADQTCADSLQEAECAGVDDTWFEGLSCVELNPPCEPPPGGSREGRSRMTGGRR